MQSILHHNSSGNRAFSGSLKNKEVHSAITLHPIKRAPLMYRMHAYNLGLIAQELRQQSLYLHRDIAEMVELLHIPKTNNKLTRGVSLFPDNDNFSLFFRDDHERLGEWGKVFNFHKITRNFPFSGNVPDLTKHSPDSRNEVIDWDFIGRSIYSAHHLNPKRKMEHSYREVSERDSLQRNQS